MFTLYLGVNIKFYDDVYIGRDNYVARQIERASGADISIQNLTRCTLEVIGTNPPFLIDSDEVPDAFDWITYGATGVLCFRLGMIDSMPLGFQICRLIIYSNDFPDGLDDLQPLYFRIRELSVG